MNEPIYCDLPIDDIIAQAKPHTNGWCTSELGAIYKETLLVDLEILEKVPWTVPILAGAFINTETKEITTAYPQDRQPVLDALRAWFADREKKRQQALEQKGEN